MTQSVIGALRVTLGLDSAQFLRGTRQAESFMQRLGRRMRNVGAAMSAVGTGLALAVRGQLNAADDAIKAAQTIGMSVEQYTRLAHAADLSGVSLEQFQTGVQRMSRVMADTPDVIENLGIALHDAEGNMRSTDDVLLDVADVLAGMPDGAEKTALAMELLGRSGANMIPLLNGGRDAIQDMMNEADRLGLTISRETAQAAEQFNDNLTRLTGLSRGLALMLTAELAPVLARISDIVFDVAQGFADLTPEVRRLAAILTVTFAVGGPVIMGLGLFLMSVKAIIAPITALLAAAKLLAPILAAIGAAFAVATAPIWGTVAAVAALTLGAVALWRNWGGVGDWMVERLTAITSAVEAWGLSARDAINRWFENASEWGSEFAQSVAAGIAQNNAALFEAISGLWTIIATEISTWPAKMMQAGRDLINGLTDGIFGGRRQAEEAAANMANSITDIVNGEFGINSPSRVFRAIGGFLTEGLALGINAGAPQAVGAMEGVANQIGSTIETTETKLDKFASGFASFIGPVVRGTQTLRSAFANMATSIGNSLFNAGFTQIGGWLGGLLGLGKADFGGFSRLLGGVPSLEGGGFTGNGARVGGVDGRGGFLSVLHPQETVVDHTRGGMGGGVMAITVNVQGANGDRHVMQLVEQGVTAGLRQYDRSLPDRVQSIQSDPRARA